jgi:hypothetical protein
VNWNPNVRLGSAAGPVRRARSQRAAIVLGVAIGLSIFAALVLHVVGARGTGGSLWVVLLPYAFVGVIIARRQPSNPMGPILLLLPLAVVVSDDAGAYAVLRYRLGHHGLPLGVVAVFLGTPGAWMWLVLFLPLPIALFPGGRLSLAWRRVLRAYLVFCVVFVALNAWQDAGGITRHISVDSNGSLTNTSSPGGTAVTVLVVSCYLGFCLAWVVRLVLSYRRSTGDERQQLKWLSGGGVLGVVGLMLVTSLNASSSMLLRVIAYAGLFVSLIALPLGIGVGILRYRLYEIDRLISRTLSYTLLTGLLVGVFAGLVLLTTRVLPFSSPVGVAASTLAAAGLFSPLRGRLQRLVDRRFNRARYDAEATVAAFGHRLRDAVDVETVLAELAAAAGRSLEPAHVTVWVRP